MMGDGSNVKKMKKLNFGEYLNICNLYIFIWVLYIFHWQNVGNAFPLLEAMSNEFLGINLIISIYYTLVFMSKYKQNAIFKSINILLISFIIYGIVSIVGRDFISKNGTRIDSGTYLIGALRTFLPIYTCFVFTKLGYITEKTIRFWSWIFFVQCIYIFFISRFVYLGIESGDFAEIRTNNTAYLFVSVFPLIYFHKNRPIIQYILIAIALFLAIMSVKRGAVLIVALATLYFFMHTLKNASGKIKLLSIVALFVLLVLGIDIVENLYENSNVFQHRVESTLEGNTSSRDVIAKELLNIYWNSDIGHIILGFGADGTLDFFTFAHNDWLEMLFDQGILGFVLYLCFWTIILKHWKNQSVSKNNLVFFLGLWIICNLTRTFFSMWYSVANIYVTMPFGYYLAYIYMDKQKNINHYDTIS